MADLHYERTMRMEAEFRCADLQMKLAQLEKELKQKETELHSQARASQDILDKFSELKETVLKATEALETDITSASREAAQRAQKLEEQVADLQKQVLEIKLGHERKSKEDSHEPVEKSKETEESRASCCCHLCHIL
ncbi:hypothetical protein RRG08_018409 [Elysia crispata]|uniref:Uncharacterized protein n=1 Tax=Elysia crispata TaxID=231223 RepID=A0AAE0YK92_9GAST|nr:hypothetical protein RRG08_018409 [Elysia crispata]